jgi:hypothetical protein
MAVHLQVSGEIRRRDCQTRSCRRSRHCCHRQSNRPDRNLSLGGKSRQRLLIARYRTCPMAETMSFPMSRSMRIQMVDPMRIPISHRRNAPMIRSRSQMTRAWVGKRSPNQTMDGSTPRVLTLWLAFLLKEETRRTIFCRWMDQTVNMILVQTEMNMIPLAVASPSAVPQSPQGPDRQGQIGPGQR